MGGQGGAGESPAGPTARRWQALRTLDGGPSKLYPGGQIKFDAKGRRVDAGLTIIQWQSGIPVTVYPPNLALAQAVWSKK